LIEKELKSIAKKKYLIVQRKNFKSKHYKKRLFTKKLFTKKMFSNISEIGIGIFVFGIFNPRSRFTDKLALDFHFGFGHVQKIAIEPNFGL